MTIDSLMLGGLVLAALGISLAIIGGVIKAFSASQPENRPANLADASLSVKLALGAVVGGGVLSGFAVVVFCVAGLWWFFSDIYHISSPDSLALVCIVLGPSPLLLTFISLLVTSLIGGRVSASGASNCRVMGLDLGPVLHSLFMAYWLALFTSGLAVLGLAGSAIWALLS